MEAIRPYIPLLIPLIIIQLLLAIFALLDLAKREKIRFLPKWAWALIIIFGEMVGPLIYFLVGRAEE